MTYDQLLDIGRKLSEEERTEALLALTGDARLGALVFHIEQKKQEFVEAIASDKIQHLTGCLQHLSGGIKAMSNLQDDLRALADHPPKPARRRKSPPREEEMEPT